MQYTQAQIDRANAVSLEDFLRTQGETLIKSGREYRWKEHDSLTVRGNKWFRHSQSKGGYPIDFVMEFYGKSFPEAVQMLTGESGEGQTEATTAPPTAFHLPLHNRTADRAIQYLCESRGLNKTLVEAFLLSGDIYEDAKRHNVVFVGRDRNGTPRYGRMVEIYLMVSLAPIPFATFGNHEQSHTGQNYLRSLFALGFQGFLIMICVGIYAVLIQNLSFSDNIISSIWGVMGYTVLLAFTLFKTGSLAKSVFAAH